VRSSANVSYENAAKDVEFFTGIRVSAKTAAESTGKSFYN